MRRRSRRDGTKLKQRLHKSAWETGTKPGDKTSPAGEDQCVSRTGLLAVLIVVVAIAVLVTHWPALSAQSLTFDDGQYLTDNPLVQNPSWTTAKRFLTEVLEPSTVKGYYQPLAMLSLMLDVAMGASVDDLYVFHRTSLALHILNTSLIILLLYLLFGQASPAALVGLLYGLHPLTVEPIPWVGERKTLLAACFALGCLVCYVRYAQTRGKLPYFGSLLCFLFALMSKPTSTPLPVLLLLLDYWPLRRLSKRSIIEKLPFFVIAALFAGITIISQDRTASAVMPGEAIVLPGGNTPFRIPLVLCHNIVFYLYKTVWPANLSSHYPYPEPLSIAHPMMLAGVIGTFILIGVLILSLRWTRALAAGWLFFFVAIFPTMGVIGFTNVIASDKYAYLPAVGLLLPITWYLGKWWGPGWGADRSTRRVVRVLVVVLLIATAEVAATRQYLKVWQDTKTLHQHMIALAPHSSSLYNNLGAALAEKGKLDEAAGYFRQALHCKPNDPESRNNLANVLVQQNKAAEAIEQYRQSLQVLPDSTETYNNMGNALYTLGKLDEAIAAYREAIRLDAENVHAHKNLGIALLRQGSVDMGVDHIARAFQVDAGNVECRYQFGIALMRQGKLTEAVVHLTEVIRRKPDWVEARAQLGAALGRARRFDEAITQFNEAIDRDPDYADGHRNLGLAWAAKGELDQAIVHYRRALQIRPDDAMARQALQDAHGALGLRYIFSIDNCPALLCSSSNSLNMSSPANFP